MRVRMCCFVVFQPSKRRNAQIQPHFDQFGPYVQTKSCHPPGPRSRDGHAQCCSSEQSSSTKEALCKSQHNEVVHELEIPFYTTRGNLWILKVQTQRSCVFRTACHNMLTSEVIGSIYMILLTGDRYDYLNPLHFSISCHWSNSLEWKLVKRPFRIHEPECRNLFYFDNIWCVLLQRKFISAVAGKRSFRGILYIALKSTNDCWVVDSTCRIRQRVHIIYMNTM